MQVWFSFRVQGPSYITQLKVADCTRKNRDQFSVASKIEALQEMAGSRIEFPHELGRQLLERVPNSVLLASRNEAQESSHTVFREHVEAKKDGKEFEAMPRHPLKTRTYCLIFLRTTVNCNAVLAPVGQGGEVRGEGRG